MPASSPIRAAAAHSEPATSTLQQPIHAAASITPTPRSTNPAEATSAHRLFWSWYGAGVDTVRYAFDVQSVLVRQMVQVSPVSLVAFQLPVAFHVAFQSGTRQITTAPSPEVAGVHVPRSLPRTDWDT